MPNTKGGSSPYEREDEADRPRYWARTHEIGFKLGDRAYGIRPIRAAKEYGSDLTSVENLLKGGNDSAGE